MAPMAPLSDPSILTRRLLLRPSTAADVPLLVELQTSAIARCFLGGTVSEARATTLAQAEIGAQTGFIVVNRRSDVPMGRVLFADHAHGGLEMDCSFLPPWWHRGYATESVRAALEWAFEELATTELLAVTQRANAPSRSLLERLGATLLDEFEEFGAQQMRFGLVPARLSRKQGPQ